MSRSFCGIVVALCVAFALLSCDRQQPAQASGDLDAAVKARTETSRLLRDVLDMPSNVRGRMEKVLVRGREKEESGDVYLVKDRYADATKAYEEAASFYGQVLDGEKVLKRLADAHEAVDRGRLLAQASADESKLKDAGLLEQNADGYEKAGEFDRAIAELESARKGYEAFIEGARSASLEDAVVARTAMLASKKPIKAVPGDARSTARILRQMREGMDEERRPKPGSLTYAVRQAVRAEAAAGKALEDRQYGPARALFARADKLYGEAAALQAKRDAVLSAGERAREAMKKADSAFKTDARPASFERGKQHLEDADKALVEDDLSKAADTYAKAREQFVLARDEAVALNELAAAQEAWAAGLAAADQEVLARHASIDFGAAKRQAQRAEAHAKTGQLQTATKTMLAATEALKGAVEKAVTLDNVAKAAPIIARLQAAIARKDKFAAEDILAELEQLIPADGRMPGLRQKVAAVPGPKKQVRLNLGRGVTMDLVLVRPGEFLMGSPDSEANRSADEGPQHKVRITRPFYMGKYEVTQAQFKAVMRRNPSIHKGAENPVESVLWTDAQDFCRKLGHGTRRKVRLPTEAEWEYACRAGTTTAFSFGDSTNSLGGYAWYSGNSGRKAHPVGQKKPNAWGLYDMHGNIWEWCQDWYDNGYYARSPASDPTGPAGGTSRVLRSGSWCHGPGYCRSAYRGHGAPARTDYRYGFRVVVSAQ